MTGRGPRKPRPPLTAESLQSIALRYVERFATSRARLAAYLRRKIAERGWEGTTGPDLEGLVERFATLGYVDDRSFALAKARSLTSRGYGARRVRVALHQAGIADTDREDAERHSDEEAAGAAVRYAQRKRLGPFATAPMDRIAREKALGTMIRAGHGFDLSRRLLDIPIGEEIDLANLGKIW